MIFLRLVFLFCICTLQALSIAQEEFIFDKAPFASCHASTLTETSDGTLLCAWFGGTAEGESDVAIWLSECKQGRWSAPRKIAHLPQVPCWNPVLCTLPSNEVLLFYKGGYTPLDWSGFLKRSFDAGRTWSQAEGLPAGILGPIKNKPLLLADGTLLCGTSVESYRRWGCWVDITPDGGRTWKKSQPINVDGQLFGIIQPTLFFGTGGEIRMLARSHQVGRVCAAGSCDDGVTWTPAVPTALPNPNAGIDAVNLQDGRVLLVYNDCEEGRSPLNVAISSDGGKTWEMKLVLEDQPGEYSYPSVIQAKNGQVHITYTWKREKIKHVVVKLI